jgi:hypothetical protein
MRHRFRQLSVLFFGAIISYVFFAVFMQHHLVFGDRPECVFCKASADLALSAPAVRLLIIPCFVYLYTVLEDHVRLPRRPSITEDSRAPPGL